MDKILFFVDDYEEAKLVFPHVNALMASGYEVAFDSEKWEIAELLALSRVLVMNYQVYDADVYVSNFKLIGVDTITIQQFLEALK